MSKKKIWDHLKQKGFSDIAAAALMGNMEAESNCVSNRLQGDFTSGFTRSKLYTEQVDSGQITREEFVNNGPNGGGYGLCQWTYQPRKAGLYDLAKSEGLSVGDEFIQVEWLAKELLQKEFKPVLDTLQTSPSIRECSDAIVKVFLRPHDQREAVLKKRADLGREMYQQFSDAEPEDPDGQPEEDGSIRITERELQIYSKAILIVTMLRDMLELLEEIKEI